MKFRFKKLATKFATASALTACMLSSAADAVTLRIATTHAPDQYATKVMEKIKSDLEGAGVDLKIKLYTSSQLGSGEQLLGEAIRGSIDIVHAFVYSHKDPVLDMSMLPFLVSSYDDMEKMYSPGSKYYTLFNERMERLGLKLLGVTSEGFIGVMASKEPKNHNTIEDKGLNIRVWSSQAAKSASQDLGFKTTTIDWADAFPAIQQGVVDGMIGATPEAAYTTFREAIKYYIPYNAFVENTSYYASKKTWEKKLNDEQRKVIQEVFSKAAATFIDWSRENDNLYLQKLEAEGVKVLTLTDEERKAIAKHIRTVTWPKLEERLGKERLDAIIADIKS